MSGNAKTKNLPTWLKVKVQWYNDEVLRVAAKQEPSALVVWPILLSLAKECSHETRNPTGTIQTSATALGELALQDADSVARALDLLAEGELIELVPGRLGTCQIRVCRFNYWQTVKGSSSDRAANSRANASREKAAPRNGFATDVQRTGSTEGDREGEGEREEKKTTTSAKADASRPVGPDHARTLFHYWLERTGRNPNQNRLNTSRRSKVKARLRDGYSVEQLRAAIDGIAATPFYTGDNDRGQRYDTFDFIMRSGENIEKGIELAAANSSSGKRARRIDVDAVRRAYEQQGYSSKEIELLLRKYLQTGEA